MKFHFGSWRKRVQEGNSDISNEWLLIRPLQSLMTSRSFQSGVVEEGNIENMQGSGSRGPELKNTALEGPPVGTTAMKALNKLIQYM